MSGTKERREDAAVTQAYLRRITGYDVTEVKEEFKVNDDGELELTKKTEKTTHIPPDPRAAEFWLTNRQPDKWRYRRNSGEDPGEEGEGGVVEIPEVREARQGDGSPVVADGENRPRSLAEEAEDG